MDDQQLTEAPQTSRDEITGEVWRRTGDCCRCGECCWGDPVNGEWGNNIIDGKLACPLLRKGSDGVFACSDRQSHLYLLGCNVYPQFPWQVANYPHCSYHFERLA